MDAELIKLTVEDLKLCQETLIDRHKETPSLCLRFDAVFKQLINSLAVYTGGNFQGDANRFTPTPIKSFLGTEIKEKVSTKLKLEKFQNNEVEDFKTKIKSIYDSFSDRDFTDLTDALEDIEIRGVAKLAGLKDFDKREIDGAFIFDIKKGIQGQAELKAKKQAELDKIEAENAAKAKK